MTEEAGMTEGGAVEVLPPTPEALVGDDNDDIDALLAENLSSRCMKPGSLVLGIVTSAEEDAEWVSVYVGLKSEGRIAKAEFMNQAGECTVKEGDEVQVALEQVEDGNGHTVLSREKARRLSAWVEMQTAYESEAAVSGYIRGRVKGGFSVEIGNVRAFLPGSLVDIQPVYDATHLENKPLDLRIIKLDQERNNVVVSRRAVLMEAMHGDSKGLLAQIEKGQVKEGIVKNFTAYGAFVDLGGVDGLLHNTDIAWRRVNHPSENLEIGATIKVMVLDVNKEKLRISLGLKQLAGEDPWNLVGENFPLQSRHKGKVTGVREYGCFVDLGEGVEGLAHASEMSWLHRKVNPSDIVSINDEVEVMVLEIDHARRRISLGLKQCQVSPWDEFKEKYPLGSKIEGEIFSITEFGLFIGLEGNITGLVHISDLAWGMDSSEAIQEYQQGAKIETVVLTVDTERERISLGIKQMTENPLDEFSKQHSKGEHITVKALEVEADRVIVAITEVVQSAMSTRDVTTDKDVKDLRELIKVGQELDVKIRDIDYIRGKVYVSMTDAEKEDQREAMKEHSQQVQREKEVTIGDVLDRKHEGDDE